MVDSCSVVFSRDNSRLNHSPSKSLHLKVPPNESAIVSTGGLPLSMNKTKSCQISPKVFNENNGITTGLETSRQTDASQVTKRRKWQFNESSVRSNSSNNEYSRTYTNLKDLSKELSHMLSPHRAMKGKKGPRLQRSQLKAKESEDSFGQIAQLASTGRDHRPTVV